MAHARPLQSLVSDPEWMSMIDEIGGQVAARSAASDSDDAFVAESIELLRGRRFYSAQVPRELGGGGATLSEVAGALRSLARYCPSTALTASMHQHLVAALVWRYRRDGATRSLLEEVAQRQAVLVSTGAGDWVESSGEATRVEGGYRVSARKIFGSGSPAGHYLITSARYEDPRQGCQTLHFAVGFGDEGVRIDETWRSHGMRGTGSHDVVFENVFVPDDAILEQRQRVGWHPLFDVAVSVALPLVMSVYAGLAEAAAAEARRRAATRRDPTTFALLGELGNDLAATQIAVDSMLVLCRDGDFEPELERTCAILTRKTLAAKAAIRCVEKAVEVVGGAAYFRKCPLERLLRDVRAAHFHPLQEKKQILFTGRAEAGLDPVAT